MKIKQYRVRRGRMRGLSLVEVMISLVIGLVVVGAVLVSYLGSGRTNRLQAAYSEMNENAQIAHSMLKNDLLLAGYAQAKGMATNAGVTTFDRTFAGRPIFGCDTGFQSVNTSGAATCAASGTPAIEISYEADVSNSVPTSGGLPSDCLGNSLNAQTVTVGANTTTYYVANNRYYLANGSTGRSELHCASSRTPALSGQPIVDNIETFQIWYGEAGAAGSRQIVRYVVAGNVVDWQNIISVRACFLMRSAEKVLSAEDTAVGATGYLDCDSVAQTSADGYLRRAYFLTTTLRNKMVF